MSRLVLSIDPGLASGGLVLADHAERRILLAVWWRRLTRKSGDVLAVDWLATSGGRLEAQEQLAPRWDYGRDGLLAILAEVLAAVGLGARHHLAVEAVVSIGGRDRGGKVSAAQLVELAETAGALCAAARYLSPCQQTPTLRPTAAEWRHTLDIPPRTPAAEADRLARVMLERRGWDLSAIPSGHAVDALGVGVWADAQMRARPAATSWRDHAREAT